MLILGVCFISYYLKLLVQMFCRDINEIKNQLNMNFANICNWSVDDNLSITFVENKTKSILFATEFKKKFKHLI